MSLRPTDQEIERDLAFAILIAREAGERALALRESGRWTGETLADVGDQAIDALLQGYLRGRYPEDGILSEETADSPHRLSRERTWIVDPIDGTKEYGQGRDDWAVHVALTIDQRCALGAVGLPTRGEVLWGVALEGRERGGSTGKVRPLSGESDPCSPRCVLASRNHPPAWIGSFAETLRAQVVPCGSVGYKVSRMLAGEADVYVREKNLNEWDTCAPEIIARGLGWHASDLTGEEHLYNQRDPRNHELVVCRPSMFAEVREAIRAAGVRGGRRR
jgi:3'(2'), 5'-bisphosphate nucleotidase